MRNDVTDVGVHGCGPGRRHYLVLVVQSCGSSDALRGLRHAEPALKRSCLATTSIRHVAKLGFVRLTGSSVSYREISQLGNDVWTTRVVRQHAYVR